MTVTDDLQLEGLRRIGYIVADAMQRMQLHTRAGMTTAELDAFGAGLLRQHGAVSAPQLVYDFPGATCISVNEVAAHGIPDERVLQTGDLINIDVSGMRDGYFADTGGSFVLGQGDLLKHRLCAAALRARDVGIAKARAGVKLNEIGRIIERSVRTSGFCNVRNLCGHGTGAALHEEPATRNYYDPRDSEVLHEGQVLTIEPFLSTNVTRVREQDDGWTLAGRPSSLFAQHEHTFMVTRGEPIILTVC